jgi:putative ABC transport system ATP-binding protein
LTVIRNQWLILVGHNGSGKSSLLRVLAGRKTPTQGQARINGKSVSEMAPCELAEAVFPIDQNPLSTAAADMTVLENLAVADDGYNASAEPRRSRQARYGDLLKPLGLADRLNQQVQTLSGGERKLLALRIARLRAADLILLDELEEALDPRNAARCLEEIAELQKTGKTIIQVTHDPELAIGLGDRTVVMRTGRVALDTGSENRSLAALKNHWF